MLLGCHVRVGIGYERAAVYASSVGCQCLQVFAKSPRMWQGPSVDPEAAATFARLRTELALGPLFTHTAYLINLGTTTPELRARSISALADELDRARALGAAAVVTHIGTSCAEERHSCGARIADAIALACASAAAKPPRLLLENTAGGGTAFGGAFAELGEVLRRLDEIGVPDTGLCLDTCHAHAFGTDLSGPAAWSRALDELDATCGIARLGLIHANDSMFACGSRRDRHAWIGDGTIGYPGFEAMMCEPKLADVPVVMEMPGEVPEKDIENLERLRRLGRRCPDRL